RAPARGLLRQLSLRVDCDDRSRPCREVRQDQAAALARAAAGDGENVPVIAPPPDELVAVSAEQKRRLAFGPVPIGTDDLFFRGPPRERRARGCVIGPAAR